MTGTVRTLEELLHEKITCAGNRQEITKGRCMVSMERGLARCTSCPLGRDVKREIAGFKSVDNDENPADGVGAASGGLGEEEALEAGATETVPAADETEVGRPQPDDPDGMRKQIRAIFKAWVEGRAPAPFIDPEDDLWARLTEEAGRLLEDHMKYIKGLLAAHGIDGHRTEIAEYHYRTAFLHGFKHGAEALLDRWPEDRQC